MNMLGRATAEARAHSVSEYIFRETGKNIKALRAHDAITWIAGFELLVCPPGIDWGGSGSLDVSCQSDPQSREACRAVLSYLAHEAGPHIRLPQSVMDLLIKATTDG